MLRTVTIDLPQLHDAQAQAVNNAARFNVLDCGRRFGKSTLLIDRIVDVAVEGYPVAWFSPTYKDLIEIWRELKVILAPITTRKNEQERRIELITGGVIEMWSLDNQDAGRGRMYKRVALDEIALVAKMMDIWNAAIRPTLVDYAGDAWFGSTPKGRNAFWQMYQWGIDPKMDEWRSWKFPTSANPFIPASEIEAMERTLPERIFRQEVMAEFVDDAGGVFRRVVEAATAKEIDSAVPGRQYIAGVDVASKVDFTVVCVMDVEAKELVYMDRFNRVDYNVLEDRLVALYKRFKLDSMTIEENSIGQPVLDHLMARGLNVQGFYTNNQTKHDIITKLRSAFEHGEIKILNDPILIGELQAFEGKQLSSIWKYGAPEGMHDDTVMALAIAWRGFGEWWFT